MSRYRAGVTTRKSIPTTQRGWVTSCPGMYQSDPLCKPTMKSMDRTEASRSNTCSTSHRLIRTSRDTNTVENVEHACTLQFNFDLRGVVRGTQRKRSLSPSLPASHSRFHSEPGQFLSAIVFRPPATADPAGMGVDQYHHVIRKALRIDMGIGPRGGWSQSPSPASGPTSVR